ncbi:MAG: T9SS type A sorting domain-containing protein [Bacteroidota bacterium]
MKNILRSTAVLLCTALISLSASAVTAINSGNWSSASTWDGPVPGSSVNNQNIVISEGITVNLDMDVTFSGLLNSFRVDGRLLSTQNYFLRMNQGSFTGTGDVDIHSMIFSSFLASDNFTGDMDVDNFTNDGSSLFLASILNVRDTMDLRDGSLLLNSGSLLQMMDNSTVRMDDGSMSIGTGGVFTTQSYNLIYVGSSKTSGIEFNGAMVRNLYIDLEDDNQSLTIGSDLTVTGDLELRRGNMDLRNRSINLLGDMRRTSNNAMLMTNAQTNILISGAGNMTDGLWFASGSQINDLTIDRTGSSSNFRLMTDLTVMGDLELNEGNMSFENGAHMVMGAGSRLVLENGNFFENGGLFDGTAEYDVEYLGTSRSTGRELTGSGLMNIGINLISENDQITLTQDLISRGNFRMDNGRTNLNGNDLTLNGTLNQRQSARFIGNSGSSMIMNLTSSSDDSIYFDQTSNMLSNFTLNKQNGGDVYLGSALSIINQFHFQRGRMDLGANNMIMQNTATVLGYDNERYFITSGQGSVQQMITAGNDWAIFPVGTRESYSPASVQQVTGSSTGMFNVRAARGVYADASNSTGVDYASSQRLLDRTWFVEATSGMTINTNLRLGWDDTFEMNGFDRNNSFISHFTNGSWDKGVAGSATAGANSSFFIERNGFNSLSPFTVMDNLTALSIDEASVVSGQLNIAPNPTADFINVTTPFSGDNVTYEVVDLTGKVILSVSNTEAINKLDVGALPRGYYFVKSTNVKTNAIVTKQFVKA